MNAGFRFQNPHLKAKKNKKQKTSGVVAYTFVPLVILEQGRPGQEDP